MRLFIGASGDVGWTSMRVVERKIKHLPDINQAVTVNLPHMHEGSYRHLLNMHEACTEKKWHLLNMHQVVIDGNWHRPHMNEGAICTSAEYD